MNRLHIATLGAIGMAILAPVAIAKARTADTDRPIPQEAQLDDQAERDMAKTLSQVKWQVQDAVRSADRAQVVVKDMHTDIKPIHVHLPAVKVDMKPIHIHIPAMHVRKNGKTVDIKAFNINIPAIHVNVKSMNIDVPEIRVDIPPIKVNDSSDKDSDKD